MFLTPPEGSRQHIAPLRVEWQPGEVSPWLLWGFNRPWYLHPLPGPLSSACFGAVRRAAQCCGLKEAGENEEWTVYWTDYSVPLERVMEMKRFQVNPPT